MLTRRYRLPGSRLPRVLGGQTLFVDHQLVIKILPNQLSLSRVAVCLSKRVLPLATRRNRLKRQLLAMIDPQKITPGFDVVILIKK